MSSILLVLLGILLIYSGVTDKAGELLAGINEGTLPGYVDIPLSRFLIGAIIVSLPALILENQEESDWAWRYVLLISVMMLVVNSRGVSQFVSYLGVSTQQQTAGSGSTRRR